jgi:hypothetical protein
LFPVAANGFTPQERRLLRSLRGFDRLQRFLDEDIGYNLEPGGATCYSPRLVLRHGVAHCMEGAMFAAAALREQGYPPLILDFESVRDDDHVLAVFRSHGCWGAVAKSNYSGLRSREPVFRTLRELAMSYFEHYFNLRREKTLRAYASRPVDLRRFDNRGWMTAEEPVWYIPEYLTVIAHRPLLSARQIRFLSRVDRRLFEAGKYGRVDHK